MTCRNLVHTDVYGIEDGSDQIRAILILGQGPNHYEVVDGDGWVTSPGPTRYQRTWASQGGGGEEEEGGGGEEGGGSGSGWHDFVPTTPGGGGTGLPGQEYRSLSGSINQDAQAPGSGQAAPTPPPEIQRYLESLFKDSSPRTPPPPITGQMSYSCLSNRMVPLLRSNGGSRRSPPSLLDLAGRGLQIGGGVAMVAAGAAFTPETFGASLLAVGKGIDNIQAGIRGQETFTYQAALHLPGGQDGVARLVDIATDLGPGGIKAIAKGAHEGVVGISKGRYVFSAGGESGEILQNAAKEFAENAPDAAKAGATTSGGKAVPSRGLTWTTERTGRSSQAARDWEDSLSGTTSDLATQRRNVPALRFDNPNPAGSDIVRFDGVDQANPNILIDRKLGVTTRTDQVDKFKSGPLEALRQNPDYRLRIEVPTSRAATDARRLLRYATGSDTHPQINIVVTPP